MEWSVAVPLASVAISLGTLLFTGVSLSQKASENAFAAVRLRLGTVETELEECKRDRDELRLTVMELKQDVILQAKRTKAAVRVAARK